MSRDHHQDAPDDNVTEPVVLKDDHGNDLLPALNAAKRVRKTPSIAPYDGIRV